MTTYFEPSIPQFYAGKTIFITGATGFLGKTLLEKFLRSCPDIGDIYVLIRQKKGKDMQERIRTLANNPVFERVKREQPNLIIEKRIFGIAGDCKLLNLGLSPEDRNMLIEKVNIIFHIAASVRFDDPLSEAIIMNVRGTREVCQLALDGKNIMAFIHVSTTYANSDRRESKEILYQPKFDWKQAIDVSEKMNKNLLNILTPKIINDFPNTYTFSKNIAEHVVKDMLGGKIPCKIHRPSVVISAIHDEPVKGWIENLNGPVGIIVAGCLGILRSTYFDYRIPQDYIPVDVVTKSLIVCAWDLVVRSSSSKIVLPLEVINACAYNTEWLRISVSQWSSHCISLEKTLPFNDVLWKATGHHTGNWYSWYIRTIFTMVLPSILFDGFLKISGKEPRLLKIQRKLYTTQTVMASISFKKFTFHNDNLLALQHRIQENDKANFDYEFQNYDIKEFIFYKILGIRRYILNMPDSTIEKARRHYNKMWWIHKFVHTIFWILFLFILYSYLSM